jgi:putative membrane protein
MPDQDTAWRPVSRAHVSSFLVLIGPLMLGIAAVGMAALLLSGAGTLKLLAPPVGAGIGFVALAALRWFEWRHTGFAVEPQRVLIRTGGWCRKTLLLPLRNVQSVTLHETSLSRKFGVASLAIDVAGGASGGQVIPSLPREQASLIRAELLSRQP